MKNFSCELKDLNDRDAWTLATVWYERGPKGGSVGIIVDEFGSAHRLEDLSSFDRAIVEKNLVFHLAADAEDARMAGNE